MRLLARFRCIALATVPVVMKRARVVCGLLFPNSVVSIVRAGYLIVSRFTELSSTREWWRLGMVRLCRLVLTPEIVRNSRSPVIRSGVPVDLVVLRVAAVHAMVLGQCDLSKVILYLI